MTVFLMFYNPFDAFKYFTNFILKYRLIYKTYWFNK